MPTITFKAKIETVYNMDDTPAYSRVKVPEIKRAHCDMPAFRKHPVFGAYANSDLFAALLRRQCEAHGIKTHLRLDQLPDCVSIDATGFLAKVTLTLGE